MSKSKPSKPRLTVRIVRGLQSVYAHAEVNLYDESDLLSNVSAGEEREITEAVTWLGRLLSWYQRTHKEA